MLEVKDPRLRYWTIFTQFMKCMGLKSLFFRKNWGHTNYDKQLGAGISHYLVECIRILSALCSQQHVSYGGGIRSMAVSEMTALAIRLWRIILFEKDKSIFRLNTNVHRCRFAVLHYIIGSPPTAETYYKLKYAIRPKKVWVSGLRARRHF